MYHQAHRQGYFQTGMGDHTDHSLENDLVGGLMTYLSDSDLMSPEETLSVYLDTSKPWILNKWEIILVWKVF